MKHVNCVTGCISQPTLFDLTHLSSGVESGGFHKRGRGRPKGVRGRVLFLPPVTSSGAFFMAAAHYESMNRASHFAFSNLRCFGRSSWLGLEHRRQARVEFALSLCYMLAGIALLKGGVL